MKAAPSIFLLHSFPDLRIAFPREQNFQILGGITGLSGQILEYDSLQYKIG